MVVKDSDFGNGCHDLDPEIMLRKASIACSTDSSEIETTTAGRGAQACFDHMAIIDRFFNEVFSIYPGSDRTMRVCVNCTGFFNEGRWISYTNCVYFGDRDRSVFDPLDENLDILAHEFGHSITQNYSCGLNYRGQSGALDESMGDIFGVMIKHYQKKLEVDNPEAWNFAEIIRQHKKKSLPLRSMKNPGSAYSGHERLGKDPQPDSMRDYKEMPIDAKNDWGGVHKYCGIPNRAFCLAAEKMKGYSYEKAGRIWFQALTNIDNRDETFAGFAGHTLQAAKSLGYGHDIQQMVAEAWDAVGVTPTLSTPLPLTISVLKDEDDGLYTKSEASS